MIKSTQKKARPRSRKSIDRNNSSTSAAAAAKNRIGAYYDALERTGKIPQVEVRQRNIGRADFRKSDSDRRWKRSAARPQEKATSKKATKDEAISKKRPPSKRKLRKSPTSAFDWSVPGIMIYYSLLMGAVSVLIHGLDLLVEWPFHRQSILQDVVFLICGATLVGLSWHTYKERERYR